MSICASKKIHEVNISVCKCCSGILFRTCVDIFSSVLDSRCLFEGIQEMHKTNACETQSAGGSFRMFVREKVQWMSCPQSVCVVSALRIFKKCPKRVHKQGGCGPHFKNNAYAKRVLMDSLGGKSHQMKQAKANKSLNNAFEKLLEKLLDTLFQKRSRNLLEKLLKKLSGKTLRKTYRKTFGKEFGKSIGKHVRKNYRKHCWKKICKHFRKKIWKTVGKTIWKSEEKRSAKLLKNCWKTKLKHLW